MPAAANAARSPGGPPPTARRRRPPRNPRRPRSRARAPRRARPRPRQRSRRPRSRGARARSRRTVAKRGDRSAFPTRDQILAYLNENPDAVGERELARAFQIGGDDRRAFRDLLKTIDT